MDYVILCRAVGLKMVSISLIVACGSPEYGGACLCQFNISIEENGWSTRVSWSPLSGLKGVQPPLPFGERTRQLYLDVCELGPEVFVGSLKGDNERLGLLALISPFLGHYSFLNGVCWC